MTIKDKITNIVGYDISDKKISEVLSDESRKGFLDLKKLSRIVIELAEWADEQESKKGL